MNRKLRGNLVLLVLLFSFFTSLTIQRLTDQSKLGRLNKSTVLSRQFRQQSLNTKLLKLLKTEENKGKIVGLYLLESKFSYQKFEYSYTKESFQMLYQKWAENKEWNFYQKICKAIWNDLKFFPIPESIMDKKLSVRYIDSWMNERTYGGKRGHEGTDIMANKNKAGLYPVISMTDGLVTNKGWLEKGGYRIGITAPEGGYFYYAHLDSYANLKEGDEVKAGDLLGYMGNSGYGEEGTRGQFPVHLHVGIYIYDGEKEISINPYWILKYLENSKLKYSYS